MLIRILHSFLDRSINIIVDNFYMRSPMNSRVIMSIDNYRKFLKQFDVDVLNLKYILTIPEGRFWY